MKFQPKTDKEIAEMGLWPVGNYSFEITEGVDKISQKGNEMIEMKVKVFNDDGGYIFVKDFLMENIAYKLKHASDACGLSENYTSGILSGMDFVGKCGTLKLKIQKGKPKNEENPDPNDCYPDKNVVGDYVVKKDGDEEVSHAAVSNGVALKDDSIPF